MVNDGSVAGQIHFLLNPVIATYTAGSDIYRMLEVTWMRYHYLDVQ